MPSSMPLSRSTVLRSAAAAEGFVQAEFSTGMMVEAMLGAMRMGRRYRSSHRTGIRSKTDVAPRGLAARSGQATRSGAIGCAHGRPAAHRDLGPALRARRGGDRAD